MKYDISEELEQKIKETISERASGRIYFPASTIRAFRKETGDHKSCTTILVAHMTDIANDFR